MTDKLQKEGLPRHSVAGKVYALRKYNNVSQAVLAEFLGMKESSISQIENGEAEYNENQLKAIKKCFNIVGLPLTEKECVTFRDRLYYLRDLVRDKKMDEAKAIQKEMANIDKLKPCDFEMVMLCKMIEVQLFIAEGNYASAEDKLNILQDDFDMMSNENLFHNFYNKGALCVYQNCHKEGLDFFLKAYDLMDDNKVFIPRDDGWLHYYIAICYSYIEIPHYAISFFQKARQIHPDNRITNFILNTDHGIAINYIKMNRLKHAEKLLNKCLLTAESVSGGIHIGVTLFCFGYMHKKAKNWKTAIEYFDKALEHFKEDNVNYYSSMNHKIQCIIHDRAFAKAGKLLEQAKNRCKGHDVWEVCFEALGHYLKISSSMTSHGNGKSIEYIENIAIPHFIKMHDYLLAVDYYSLLEQHYKKLKSTMKSLTMSKAKLNIYTRCYVNLGEEIES